MTKLVRWLPVLLVVGLLCFPSIAKADGVTVFVGYADNLRPSGFFPTPWLGASNVVSQTPAAESFDTGAVRIDNTGTTPITITNFTVTLNPGSSSPIVLNFWGPQTITPGQNAIFTQLVSYNFDSSDVGIFGGAPPALLDPSIPGNNAIGGCSSTPSILAASGFAAACAANAPLITFDENGVPESFTDTGQILNTGGYDFLNRSSDGNESIDWNVVGSAASRGGTGVPEPSSMVLLGSGSASSASPAESSLASKSANNLLI